MAGLLDIPIAVVVALWTFITETPLPLLLLLLGGILIASFATFYISLYFLAPIPRPPHPSERTYITSTPDGKATAPLPLPDWHDAWLQHRDSNESSTPNSPTHPSTGHIEPAEVAMSVVIPAYNEENRLETMLEEAIAYLDAEYGRPSSSPPASKDQPNGQNGHATTTATNNSSTLHNRHPNTNPSPTEEPKGYEILLINDGSTDATVRVALDFSHRNALHHILRIVTLTQNRGKGGAVTHGLRHVRGAHAIFADADGASRFADLSKLVTAANDLASLDPSGRAIAVGSRAHLVGSEAVVKRSWIRNLLMHAFHLLLWFMTPRQTSQIKDTQCGFKLFTRPALPHVVPYMHAEGWIFDVEMLMLAESAPTEEEAEPSSSSSKSQSKVEGTSTALDSAAEQDQEQQTGIRVAEVPIGWKEIGGSKLNVLRDSIGMAYGLALLRACWALGVYRRR